MTIIVPIEDAQKRLAELCELASKGEDVLLTQGGQHAWRITPAADTPYSEPRGQRRLGVLQGRGHVAETFNDPMPDFEDAFYCGS